MSSLSAFNMMRSFNTQYRSYSASKWYGKERKDVEKGGKIIMPPSALDQLTRLNTVYPMLFKLTNKKSKTVTHCGVLLFMAEEGRVYLPPWMMKNLLLEERDMLRVENVTLPLATFSKFQPQSCDFLNIPNPRIVLERNLGQFACLTKGDMIAVEYRNKIYEINVLKTKPKKAVSIIECDMDVEFALPVGYQDPADATASLIKESELANTDGQFVAFQGDCNCLDGKDRRKELCDTTVHVPQRKRGIPDRNYQIGTLRFLR